ncbi:MAG: hypothetical protein IJJ15_05365 [Ruminococcus sp.]|nr:hypothetical protein [Ruminococcus sp.]
MSYLQNHPTLIAVSRCGSEVLKRFEDVADHILNVGLSGDIYFIDTNGEIFMTTNGIFVDYAIDEEYEKEGDR